MLTASRLELAMRCEGHLTLPHVDEPNEWSDGGNARHAEDEAAIGAGDVPEAYTSRWPEITEWRSEVSYMYDVATDTSRFLGVGIKRRYGERGPFEIPGTIDVEGRGPGVLVIVDKKSFEAVTPSASNPQVRFLALAAARVAPADAIHVAINHELTGLDAVELDPVLELDVIAAETRQLLVRTADVRHRATNGEPVSFVTGRHCRWCPAFAACPKQAELTSLARLDDDHPEMAIRTMIDDDETARDVYDLWKRVGILHKRLGQRLGARAVYRPIPLGNGKMYGLVEKQGNEKIDGEIVHATMVEQFGVEMADKAIKRTTSKKAIEAALKGKPKGSPTMKKLLDVVRERGGATRSAGQSMEEYTPGPQLVLDSSTNDE